MAPSSRIGPILLVCSLVLATAVCLDVLTCAFTHEGIREGDWVVFAAAVAFMACAVKRRAVAQKLSIGLLAGTLSLLGVEGLLSVATYDVQRPQSWYVWPPKYRFRVSPENLVGIAPTGNFTTNSLGMRGDELPADAAYRILCIGGSTTECFYLDDAKAWPRLLEERLRADLPGVWVGNVGRSGLMTTDHLELLTNLPEVDRADCWVILCGLNDFGLRLKNEYEQAARNAFARTFAWRRPGLSGRWDRPLFRNTYSYSLVSGTIRRVRLWWKSGGNEVVQDYRANWIAEVRRLRQAAPKTDDLPDLTAAVDEYEQNLRRIVAISRQKGKRLILMTQPAIWDETMPAELESLCWGGVQPDGHCLTAAALACGLEAFNERLRAVCLLEGIECVDLAVRLPKSTATFYDDCHFNEGGAEQVAEQLAVELQRSTPVLARSTKSIAR